jgi:hypothetical protein
MAYSPLKYPWRKPYRTWLSTTAGLLAILLFGTIWLERSWGVTLPPWGIEAIVVFSCFVGLGAAIRTFHRQSPPEPGDLDDPSW